MGSGESQRTISALYVYACFLPWLVASWETLSSDVMILCVHSSDCRVGTLSHRESKGYRSGTFALPKGAAILSCWLTAQTIS
jgi:hypothetical protein